MKPRLNIFLSALAVALLIVSLWVLGWLHQHIDRQVQASVATVVDSFKPHELLHGPGGQALADFTQFEQLARRAMESPYIHQVIVTRAVAGGGELPLVPFDLRARQGDQWLEQLARSGWRREPLGDPAAPFGFIYMQMQDAALRSMKWAIGAVAIAIGLMLTTLLARVWSQHTSITRTVIELNERRRELIRLERLSMAGQLSASLLHDLRKPVLHIKHSLDDLTEALGDFSSAAAPLQDLRRQTRLFFQMLSDSQIERFVQSERAGEEYVEPLALIDFSLNLVRYEQRSVEVIRRDGENIPPVKAYPFRLVQVFSNLILNAYQAMEGRGRLTIETLHEKGFVVVSVIDDGPGIAAENLEHVFEPFFTTKPQEEGTGLGLAICRMIVDEMNGQLTVQSRLGGPTRFQVRLPVE